MSRIVGFLSLLFGATFLFLAIVAALNTSTAWGDVAQEPEDFYLLLFWSVVSGLVGALAVVVGSALIRDPQEGRVSGKAVLIASAAAVLVLGTISVLGFVRNDPSSAELRLLLVPAAVFASAFYIARRRMVRGRVIEGSRQ